MTVCTSQGFRSDMMGTPDVLSTTYAETVTTPTMTGWFPKCSPTPTSWNRNPCWAWSTWAAARMLTHRSTPASLGLRKGSPHVQDGSRSADRISGRRPRPGIRPAPPGRPEIRWRGRDFRRVEWPVLDSRASLADELGLDARRASLVVPGDVEARSFYFTRAITTATPPAAVLAMAHADWPGSRRLLQ
jgi:hypothetical protein